jgi:hypothetical protein
LLEVLSSTYGGFNEALAKTPQGQNDSFSKESLEHKARIRFRIFTNCFAISDVIRIK